VYALAVYGIHAVVVYAMYAVVVYALYDLGIARHMLWALSMRYT